MAHTHAQPGTFATVTAIALRALRVIAQGLAGSLLGVFIGATIGGNFMGDFEFAAVRGYEATAGGGASTESTARSKRGFNHQSANQAQKGWPTRRR